MKVIVFANRMPDLCGAFLHDVDLALELQKRGHEVTFLIIKVPKEGLNGGTYRGFRFLHYTAGESYLQASQVWICPHAPVLPDVRKLNSRGYYRPVVVTCHYDGNYTVLTKNYDSQIREMLLFINKTMEPNYRKNIVPWPASIVKTDIIRPIMHEDKITIREEFKGDMITLVNANQNKGVHQFLELARKMPQRRFLGVLPYYGELQVPPSPPNIDWIPFDDDIRNILKRTRILLVPSYYESFGRIAVEAMINGIPVLYSKPMAKSRYPGGSTEGMQEWIGDAGIACDRDIPEEWMAAITALDTEDIYEDRSRNVKEHIHSMNLFTEASRIAQMVETFARENPVVVKTSGNQQSAVGSDPQKTLSTIVPKVPRGPVGFGAGRGLLKIRR
jgi:glycosyltransferase involved in cell wall biosynthesis